jgi:hypothetical protein
VELRRTFERGSRVACKPRHLAALLAPALIVAGCSSPAPEAPKVAPTSAPAAAPKTEPAGSPAGPAPTVAAGLPAGGATPVAAAKAASSAPRTASPVAAARPNVTPRGKLTYGMHITLSPVWLDPLESGNTLSDLIPLPVVRDALVRFGPGNTFVPSLGKRQDSDDEARGRLSRPSAPMTDIGV